MADSTSGLEAAASATKMDLNSIVNGASKCLKLIEPWFKASTDDPALEKIIQEIRKHGATYRDAIDMSIQTAQAGYNFSIDAIDLCDFLLEPDISLGDLEEYVRSMQDVAKRAHQDSARTFQMFKSVQHPIRELTMPVLQVAALMKADSGKARDAELQLKQALIDFGTLSDSVDDFSAWLVRMVQLQSTTDSIASSLQMAKAQKLKIKSLKKSWDAIRDDYAKYNVQIKQLQDLYPSRHSTLGDESVQPEGEIVAGVENMQVSDNA